jgi:hypothetical protein
MPLEARSKSRPFRRHFARRRLTIDNSRATA